MSYLIIIILLLIISDNALCNESFSKKSDAGVVARLDLMNSLKLAMKLSKPHPTKAEKKAGVEFVKFLNSWRSNEYLEAFYAVNRVAHTNKFQQFLNGILFNGNPTLRIWKAAETLSKMLKKKTDIVKMEEMRLRAKKSRIQHVNSFIKSGKILRGEDLSTKDKEHIDYLEIYKKTDIIPLKNFLDKFEKNLTAASLV